MAADENAFWAGVRELREAVRGLAARVGGGFTFLSKVENLHD
jgi:hypothetical protein